MALDIPALAKSLANTGWTIAGSVAESWTYVLVENGSYNPETGVQTPAELTYPVSVIFTEPGEKEVASGDYKIGDRVALIRVNEVGVGFNGSVDDYLRSLDGPQEVPNLQIVRIFRDPANAILRLLVRQKVEVFV